MLDGENKPRTVTDMKKLEHFIESIMKARVELEC